LTTAVAAPQSEIPIHGDGLNMPSPPAARRHFFVAETLAAMLSLMFHFSLEKKGRVQGDRTVEGGVRS
jgi:hypothetical protein